MEIEENDNEEIIELKRLYDELRERRLRLINQHDTDLLLRQMETLGNMIVKVAKMIRGRDLDIDNLINQDIKIPKFPK